VRRRDWHILTNGLLTFTSDSRFKVLYKEGSFNWVLQVQSLVAGLLTFTSDSRFKVLYPLPLTLFNKLEKDKFFAVWCWCHVLG
jgi:hypothetical protein